MNRLIVTGLHFLSSVVVFAFFSTTVYASKNDEKVVQLQDDYFSFLVTNDPMWAIQNSEGDFSTPFPKYFTEDYEKQWLKGHSEFLQRLKKIDVPSLSKRHRVFHRALQWRLETTIANHPFAIQSPPIGAIDNRIMAVAAIGSGRYSNTFKTLEDYEQWHERMGQIPGMVDDVIQRFTMSLENKITLSAFETEQLIQQLSAFEVERIENSIFYRPVTQMPLQLLANQKQYVIQRYTRMIESRVLPSIKKLKSFLQKEYLPKVGESISMRQLPKGEAWYSALFLEASTSLTDAEQWHRLGLKEIERIERELRSILKELNYDGDIDNFWLKMFDDPMFGFRDSQSVLVAFNNTAKSINQNTPKYFTRFPRKTYVINEVPQQHSLIAPLSFYQGSPADSLRPATFYVNAARFRLHQSWQIPLTLLREVSPGFHFQHTLENEVADYPKWTKYFPLNAYVNGWTAYAQSMGIPLRVISTGTERFGLLMNDLKRTAKMVADTGVHVKGWDQRNALDYLMSTGRLTEREAKSELLYIVSKPGFSVAEKVGELTFRMKIGEWGDKVDKSKVKKMDELLEFGALPLLVIEDL